MRAALLLIAGLGAGCGGERALERPAPRPAAPASLASARYVPPPLPTRESLPCFRCHDFAKFGEDGRFPHDLKAHRRQGHCHRCHVGISHRGNAVDLEVCKGCHEELPEGFSAPAAPP